jgi:hypothetical protein
VSDTGQDDGDGDRTRRSFLAAASAGTIAVLSPVVGSEDGRRRTGIGGDGFDPVRHGFGFFNWRVSQGPYPGAVEAGSTPDHGFSDRWEEPFERAFDHPLTALPDRLRESLSRHAHEGLIEVTRTDGYCYGMVFAAQRYFERPGTIPAGFERASEIGHPEAPLSSPETPVLDEIVAYHTAQYLDFYAWFGRYAIARPSLIDYAEQLRELTAVLDVYGTAGVTLVRGGSSRSHQVLVYGYDRRSDGVTLDVYDPNYRAALYEERHPTIEIDTTGDEPTIDSIDFGSGYRHVVHNEYDRLIREGHEGRDRTPSIVATPDAMDRLFDAALFVEVEGPVRTAVTDPDGRPLDRTDGENALHYRYGADPGTHLLSVAGEAADEYAIDAYAGGYRGDLFEERREASIDAGEVHRYELTVDYGGGLRRL